jgi:hypothetical protein
MAHRNSTAIFGVQIHTLFSVGAIGALTDGALLDHFTCGMEAAEPTFATLVRRHGPMVLRVCRNLLTDAHLAEDGLLKNREYKKQGIRIADRQRPSRHIAAERNGQGIAFSAPPPHVACANAWLARELGSPGLIEGVR